MSPTHSLTPAELADLDGAISEARRDLDGLVSATRKLIALSGGDLTIATSQILAMYLMPGRERKNASIAAMALVELARRPEAVD